MDREQQATEALAAFLADRGARINRLLQSVQAQKHAIREDMKDYPDNAGTLATGLLCALNTVDELVSVTRMMHEAIQELESAEK